MGDDIVINPLGLEGQAPDTVLRPLRLDGDVRQRSRCAVPVVTNSKTSPTLGAIDNLDEMGTDEGETQEEKLSLLPDLPDELTIDRIVTRVPWTTLCSLSTVNRAWHRAIFERKLYDARVRTNSTQAFVVIIHEAPPSYRSPDSLSRVKASKASTDAAGEPVEDDPVFALFPLAVSLYNPDMDAWHVLPPIPGMSEGIPHECECICTMGKLYILGGLGDTKTPLKVVHMLDLGAGHGKWLRCASMQRGRIRFSCHVNDGKIFAFGGISKHHEVLAECEVFDIEQNMWSSVPPMQHRRTDHKVAFLEGEFYVHGGLFCRGSSTSDETESEEFEHPQLLDAEFAEVFDPCKNRWRKVLNFKRGMQGPILEMKGKLMNLSMSINHNSVEIYTRHSNSWISSQPITWKISEPGDTKVSFKWPMYVLYQAIGLDDEILAWLFSIQYIEKWQKNYLLRSKGLSRKGFRLEWEKMASASLIPEHILCMRRIQL